MTFCVPKQKSNGGSEVELSSLYREGRNWAIIRSIYYGSYAITRCTLYTVYTCLALEFLFVYSFVSILSMGKSLIGVRNCLLYQITHLGFISWQEVTFPRFYGGHVVGYDMLHLPRRSNFSPFKNYQRMTKGKFLWLIVLQLFVPFHVLETNVYRLLNDWINIDRSLILSVYQRLRGLVKCRIERRAEKNATQYFWLIMQLKPFGYPVFVTQHTAILAVNAVLSVTYFVWC